MAYNTKSVIDNNQFAVLHANGEKHWYLIKDKEELDRWVKDGSIKSGDIVIELTKENVKVATLKNYIELK